MGLASALLRLMSRNGPDDRLDDVGLGPADANHDEPDDGRPQAPPLVPPPGRLIASELLELASVYGLSEDRLGRLAAFGQAHPELAKVLGAEVVEHLRSLPADHPARAALSPGADHRYERLALRLLSGRLDHEVIERIRVRMGEPLDDGTPTVMVFMYATIIPPLVHRAAIERGHGEAVAVELSTTISVLATIFAILGSHMFTQWEAEKLIDVESTRTVAAELTGISGALTRVASGDGPSSLPGRVQTVLGTLETTTANASDIGRVIELIGTIAAQTNLLALNATIEAARAGESGKGFAVVAAEVKGLARMTHESLEDIEQLVNGMQTSVGTAVTAVKDLEETAGDLTSAARSMTELSDRLDAIEMPTAASMGSFLHLPK